MDIKSEVQKLIKLHETNDPFKIAKYKKIKVLFEDLGSMWGYHNYDSRFHFIHINQRLNEKDQTFACAHELGHVLFHPTKSMTFLRNTSICPQKGIEHTAHTFAVELLIPDQLLQEYPGHSVYEIARIAGVPEKLSELKKFSPLIEHMYP